jgi:hypothetical protein
MMLIIIIVYLRFFKSDPNFSFILNFKSQHDIGYILYKEEL